MEDKLRILLNNRISGVWTENNDIELSGNAVDNFIIDIPDFLVEYQEDVQYGYSSEKSKGNLRSVLEKASRGYCMYCYRKIVIDGIGTGHLEHAVEKDYSPKLE
ncbi:MAG: hypothetical protein HFG36_07485 [Eubacterium sp.]|nr:hypothetical protein [Eubacterium sp.]